MLSLNIILLGYLLYQKQSARKYFFNKINVALGFNDAPKGDYLYGIDVSEYQGVIKWEKIADSNEKQKVDFVMIRSTAGKNHRDRFFTSNWRDSKKTELIRGAYHYFRPNENSLEQAEFYIKNVKLKPGDLPPILDIEELSDVQSENSLILGLKLWLDKVEEHYGIKPILYSGAYFYNKYLKKDFSDYTLWVANYNPVNIPINNTDWLFWQYSDEGNIAGIKGPVDLDVFKGDVIQMTDVILK